MLHLDDAILRASQALIGQSSFEIAWKTVTCNYQINLQRGHTVAGTLLVKDIMARVNLKSCLLPVLNDARTKHTSRDLERRRSVIKKSLSVTTGHRKSRWLSVKRSEA